MIGRLTTYVLLVVMLCGATPVIDDTSAAVDKKSKVEVLYNGIVLPEVWPPRQETLTREPLATPPYLVNPPDVIPIDVGRQLFVDDFLIADTTLQRRFHRPQYHAANPVLMPDKAWEGKGGRARAGCFSDGVWFDPKDNLFKMWYWASSSSLKPLSYDTCLAVSKDGIRWEKPEFDVVAGTNVVVRDEDEYHRNSSTVWLDLAEKDPERRYKMFRVLQKKENRIRISFSADGVHWKHAAFTDTVGDRTTVFHNPFRNVWVFGLRTGTPEVSRCRGYCEFPTALPGTRWAAGNKGKGKVLWVGADKLDPPREDLKLKRVKERPFDLVPSQLYNLDCVAYESVMLGLFSIFRGIPFDRPKINEVCVGYSRDGFHWSRPDRSAFLPVSEKKEDWNWGNVQSAGGCCLVVGDHLYFYVAGVSGRNTTWHNDPANVGLGILRRDGFASMEAGKEAGTLTTRAVRFSGKYLFVNAAAAKGELRADVVDKDDKVIAPYTRENCEPIRVDKTRVVVKWRGADDLAKLAGTPVRLRFHVRDAALYAFWVSPDASGASHGYVAAGGPGFTSPKDDVGSGR
jgi:hypothetical protein